MVRQVRGEITRARILAVMREYTTEHGRPPSQREILAAVGTISGSGTLTTHLRVLEAEGKVARLHGMRGWRVLSPPTEPPIPDEPLEE